MVTVTSKVIFIDAIMGGCPTGYSTKETEHLMIFTGNQHNLSWVWDRTKFEKMDLEQIMDFYANHRNNY